MSPSTAIPHTRPGQWPPIRPDRFAATIRADTHHDAAIALLGLPDDTGVRLNGGRPGAALGPAALRAALSTFGTSWDSVQRRRLDVGVFDAGDVEPAEGADEAALLCTHARVEASVRRLHDLGLLPVCIGGGHDLSLPSLTALSKHLMLPLGGVNLDAHLDARERIGSGMAFRHLINGGFVDPSRFVEFGLNRFANDEVDFRWLEACGATLMCAGDSEPGPPELFARALGKGGLGFVSIDLDGLDAATVPGVSALNPAGVGLREAARLAEAAGREPRVLHFDIMELSPPNDPGGRSARVAAYLFLSFLTGFCERAP